ncbi:TPA: flagellar biosynthesis protein FlhB [Aeromonas salmonicida]|uniref:flagellar type III secretion system protein FlhB n=1 Tax=Aeromonas salmonicida TaxID=645 RepID=UPI000452DBC7|nr:flagellar type III secretion system protein FlhB [Aeromonas salmonicida]ASI22839.1 flagellar biosynthesis protein FlhB [Aeromonas salmonicida]ASI27154.1 flagellar biosynthesis protein FlhB [Aeromonas salmonicida]ASI31272.1 flagellar biosynthesis protein FlhB [Aeromonas salmonicida]ELI6418686.1 flagellar biosynthesis protein FlhB [Aeromonas salmonicida subsp. salmonicida]ELI6441856.1 flagellar biosynthesis protein FlhB [Aeromonas salmonicida subsp. salmonicida]
MADTDQERTEQPTGKRLQQAREKGQIARSKELGTASVLLAAVFGLLMVKESLASAMVKILTIGFTLDRDQAFDPNAMGAMLPALLRELVYPLGLLWMLIILCCALIPIVAIDVPFQTWNHTRQLKMTKQEVKDEFKDSEGKPEVKGRIRQLQMQMAMRRMMGDVPKADVIITNPTHYSVALKYDIAKPGAAPKVVAKGTDEIAMKIREIAREYEIPIMPSPALTRAIFHSTEIGHEIPEGLFAAVAQVLAYIYQLKKFRRGSGRRPNPIAKDLPIPPEFRK